MFEGTRYINSYQTDRLFFSDIEWISFLETIQTECKFSTTANGYSGQLSLICDTIIEVKYFFEEIEGQKLIFYHVSNDDRRKMIKYLRDRYGFSKLKGR